MSDPLNNNKVAIKESIKNACTRGSQEKTLKPMGVKQDERTHTFITKHKGERTRWESCEAIDGGGLGQRKVCFLFQVLIFIGFDPA